MNQNKNIHTIKKSLTLKLLPVKLMAVDYLDVCACTEFCDGNVFDISTIPIS